MLKTLQLRLLMPVVVVAILAFCPSWASADEITFADLAFPIDSPTQIEITLGHALEAPFPHTSVINTTTTASGFWSISLTIVEGSNRSVRVSGEIRHLKSPPGHPDGGAGPRFQFDLLINSPLVGEFRVMDVARCCNPMHDVDFDRYVATLTAVRQTPPNADLFAAFNLKIEGVHTPEPATLLLLGTGLTAVAIKARRKLKSRKSSQPSQ